MARMKNENITAHRVITKRSVKQMIQGELLAKSEMKVQDTPQLTQASATAGTILNVTQQIIQGDLISQRTGNQLSLHNVEIRLNAYNAGGAVTVSQVRLIVFQDTQNLGVVPAVTDLLAAANYSSFYNSSEQYQQRRFKILDDWISPLNQSAANASVAYLKCFKAGRLNKQVTFQGVTNVAASNGRNAVFACVIFFGANAGITYDFNSLVQYTDL